MNFPFFTLKPKLKHFIFFPSGLNLRTIPLLCARVFLLVTTLLSTRTGFSQDELAGLTSNGGAEGGGTAFTIKTNGTGFATIKNFANWGGAPLASLTLGADGNYYGVASDNGSFKTGTIFRMTPAGNITILKQLNLAVDGGYPKGTLLLAKDGSFYGTLSAGTVNNGGGIFRITTSGVYTIVRSLSVNTDGGRPAGKLIQGTDGNFYGMNYGGGAYGYGNIFKLTTAGVYTVLKSFNYKPDGGNPYGSLIQGKDGNFYGMTYWGGTYGFGTIFKLTPAGVYTVLRHFNSAADGAYPQGDLLQAKDGLLYGMTKNGGLNANGTIFKITTAGVFSVLRNLSASVEGANPKGNLIQGTDGNFYGLTNFASGGFHGTVFKMTAAGVVTVIKKLTAPKEGGYPSGSLVQGPDGLFYGMTTDGGQNFYGTIFKISSTGVFTVLSHFNGATHGNIPQENLVLGKDSSYYGVTNLGGVYNFGTIFKICGGTTTVLRSFNKNTDGGTPVGSLVRATDGNFYGMTLAGGINSGGTIFKITPAGVFTVLRHLKATTDGGSPYGSLIQGTDGFLYGMTSSGGTGAGAGGTIFKISTAGVFTVLRHIVSATDGANPQGGLVQGKDGNFYGMTSLNPRFFKITSAGVFTVLQTLNSTSHGTTPSGALVQGTDGNFYGTCGAGGTNGGGTILKITPAGVITTLRSLVPTTDGSNPRGGLVQASDGNFYGLTSNGGTNKVGTIFRIAPTGTFAVIRHLKLETDGGTPTGGLILAPKNNLVANPQSNIAVQEDVAKAVVLSGTGSTTLVYNIAALPKHGTVTGTGKNRTYTPFPNYVGRDSFAFTVGVGCMTSRPAYVSFNVTGVNDAPVLAPIGAKSGKKGTLLTFTATATDPDAGQTRTFSLITPPAGAVINSSTGVFSWTPAAAGTFTCKVRVTDNGSPILFDEETITITVAAATISSASILVTEERKGSPVPSTKAQLYPNPVLDKGTVVLSESFKTVTSNVFNLRGSVVLTNRHRITGANTLELDLSSLTPGQYVVQVKTENGINTFKVIKR